MIPRWSRRPHHHPHRAAVGSKRLRKRPSPQACSPWSLFPVFFAAVYVRPAYWLRPRTPLNPPAPFFVVHPLFGAFPCTGLRKGPPLETSPSPRLDTPSIPTFAHNSRRCSDYAHPLTWGQYTIARLAPRPSRPVAMANLRPQCPQVFQMALGAVSGYLTADRRESHSRVR